jgi:hypothetical protein
MCSWETHRHHVSQILFYMEKTLVSNIRSEATSLDYRKAQCLIDPSVPLQLADEKSRID